MFAKAKQLCKHGAHKCLTKYWKFFPKESEKKSLLRFTNSAREFLSPPLSNCNRLDPYRVCSLAKSRYSLPSTKELTKVISMISDRRRNLRNVSNPREKLASISPPVVSLRNRTRFTRPYLMVSMAGIDRNLSTGLKYELPRSRRTIWEGGRKKGGR